MTGDELDRAIDFLLKSHAGLEARIEQVNQNLGERIEEVNQKLGGRIEETNRQLADLKNLVGEQGQTLTHFIQVATHSFEQHAETISELKESNLRIANAIDMLAAADIAHAAAQSRTDERLDALINTVERYISGRGEERP
ncbi:MAG TPA: hypothetical protein VGX48_05415 [Pyrinomonadaceae bacterium]|jgi:ferritin-like metal-binding protein YciE|nr:hypothetical protein [Pyrinomonadaceae bacterium]